MPRALHSFPTRRSSDLRRAAARLPAARPAHRHLAEDRRRERARRPARAAARARRPGRERRLHRAHARRERRRGGAARRPRLPRSEEHTSELQSRLHLVCPELYTLSLHDALPIFAGRLLVYLPHDPHIGISQKIGDESGRAALRERLRELAGPEEKGGFIVRTLAESAAEEELRADLAYLDRKSTRLNSSHGYISYAPSSTLFPYTTLFRSSPGGCSSTCRTTRTSASRRRSATRAGAPPCASGCASSPARKRKAASSCARSPRAPPRRSCAPTSPT